MSYFILIRLPAKISSPDHHQNQKISRDDFYAWLWNEADGLLGIDEGTVLSEQAAVLGLETESWTVDAGEAPRERDWVGSQGVENVRVYFETEQEAKDVSKLIFDQYQIKIESIGFQKPEDWDAQWKVSYKGVEIAPFFEVRPPWFEPSQAKYTLIKLNPGAGFGTGTHETTQLCLEEIGRLGTLQGKAVLDFGSGSGILAVAAKLKGAERVIGVEIDPLAIENAVENAKINGFEKAEVSFYLEAPLNKNYDIVIANILRPVLLQFADFLVESVVSGGAIVLSGLIDSDVSQIVECYNLTLKNKGLAFDCHIRSKGEWRSILYQVK